MKEFVLHFDAPREHNQLANRRGLFQVHAVVDRDARLQMGDIDKSSAQISSEPFKFRAALPCRPRRPRFQAHKHDDNDDRDNQRAQRERQRP